MKSESWKSVLIFFYFHTHTLVADNILLTESIIPPISAQPCDDFYSYACYGYNKETSFLEFLRRKGLLAYGNEEYNKALFYMLEAYGRQRHQLGESCQTLSEKVRNYFESCRKVSKINLIRYLEEVKPGSHLNWPILENARWRQNRWPTNGKSFDILSLVAKLNSIGVNELILTSFDYNNEAEGASISILPYSASNETHLAHRYKLLNMLSSMGVENPTEILEGAYKIQDILEGKAKYHEADIRVSFDSLIKRYPNLNFQSYFFEKIGKLLPPDITVRISNPSYFHDLNIAMSASLDMSSMCNYLMMRYLQLFDISTAVNRKFCLEELRGMFNMAINFLYYRRNIYYLEEVARPDIKELLETVKQMLREHLQSHELGLTIYKIESLKKKLASIRLNIGNFPANASCEMMEELYSSVPPLDENNYYKNHLIMMRFNERKRFSAPFDTFRYGVANLPAIIASGEKRMLILSYSDLMPPVYDVGYSNLEKYSLLGFILAWRLVIQSKLLDVNDGEDVLATTPFRSALECFEVDLGLAIRQYDRVVNSVATDVVRKIVTINFFNLQPIETVRSWKRKFFLYVTEHFCSKDDYGYAFHDNESDSLNRVAMNTEIFAQAFQCPKDSAMNPSKKCST